MIRVQAEPVPGPHRVKNRIHNRSASTSLHMSQQGSCPASATSLGPANGKSTTSAQLAREDRCSLLEDVRAAPCQGTGATSLVHAVPLPEKLANEASTAASRQAVGEACSPADRTPREVPRAGRDHQCDRSARALRAGAMHDGARHLFRAKGVGPYVL
jgi:hypothetical protein